MLKSYRVTVIIVLSSLMLLYFFLEKSYITRILDLNLSNYVNEVEEDFDFLRKGSPPPWFLKNGRILPVPKNRSRIWPDEGKGDRITNQLMYVPKEIPSKFKTIYAKHATYLQLGLGQQIFTESKCPVNACIVIDDEKQADAVIYQLHSNAVRDSSVPLNQIWVHYCQESPFYSGESEYVNWTMTYRRDSDIVFPYEKWVYYDRSIKTKRQEENYAEGKTKMIAWFVSNCWAWNGRAEYAWELKKYIDVDIYGRCGDMNCPRGEAKCMELLRRQYKFYLAFENCNCRDYITEKLFDNALQNNVLPIVMGAHPDDYEKVAPYKSYIHVDHFPSPKELADYLHKLDKNDSLYNSYFQWKGTGEFIERKTYYHCRLCAMLHDNRPTKFYESFVDWWRKPGTCIKGSWLRKPFSYHF